MAVKVNESKETKLGRRGDILSEIFVGCEFYTEELDDDVSLVHIKRAFGRYKKELAYLEYSSTRDEFHILQPKVEPLAVISVERFKDADVEVLERNMPEITVLAHYRVAPSMTNTQLITRLRSESGRVDVCKELLEAVGKETKEEEF